MSFSRPSVPFAILASGRGSNFDAIAKAIDEGKLQGKICAILSDRADAEVLEKAKRRGVPALCVPVDAGPQGGNPEERRQRHERKILEALAPFSPRFLVLAGYMRILTDELIEAFRSERGYARIVNIHPSLLPSFPGARAYAQAFSHGVKVTGASVHLVEREVDCGPICAQEAFEIGDCGSPEEVERRGLEVEHRLYPEALQWILPESFEMVRREGRACVRKN